MEIKKNEKKRKQIMVSHYSKYVSPTLPKIMLTGIEQKHEISLEKTTHYESVTHNTFLFVWIAKKKKNKYICMAKKKTKKNK